MLHDIQVKIIASIIANQMALNFNEDVKHTTIYKNKLKQSINKVLEELLKAEKAEYCALEEGEAGEHIDEIQKAQFLMIQLLSELGLHAFGDILQILLAYNKSKSKIMGVADRINK
jgi:uncharacterized protein YaaW (UPF0174 family)